MKDKRRFARLVHVFAACVAVLLLAPGHAGAVDVERGRVVAGVRCGPCHYLDKPLKKVGPGLAGIFNRAPRIAGVPFARWDRQALNRWLSGPRKVKPNTRMFLPPLSARDRNDIVAWLAARGNGMRKELRVEKQGK